MKTHKNRRWMSTVLGAFFLLFGATFSLAAHHEKSMTSASDVKKSMAETYQVIKSYTIEQRDDALAAAEEKLDKLDGQVENLQKEMDQEWENMSREARQEARASLHALLQMRNDAAEWYGGMRHSSEEAWEDVKKGFADSFDRLEKAFQKAKKDFSSKN